MDREINLDPIRALEEQIQEYERAIIQLKRTRNSLLNVSIRLPPEILGRIFHWNVIPDGDFHRLPKASHNFLPVCYHWYQVALGTPELWSFWGNSIQDWGRRHTRCRTAPLDLVLSGREGDRLDGTLHDALQDRATQDIIRRVHLRGAAGLLNSVISSIITKGEEAHASGARSFIVQNTSRLDSVDISNFFSRYNFPKLQCLCLFGFSISSWDLLESRTTSLTTLSLTGILQSPLPTLSQVLSILSTNPNLQCLELSIGSVPHSDGDRFSSRIQLCCLKTLYLRGNTRRVFGLLSRLELPDKMGNLSLFLSECLPLDVPQTLGPYLGNYIRRRSPGRLRFSAVPYLNHFYIKAGDACEGDLTNWFMAVEGELGVALAEEEADKLCSDIIAHIPKEEIIEVITASLPIIRSKELCIQMYSLTYLHLEGITVSTLLAEPEIHEPHVFKDILRGLHSISISEPSLSGGDWSPLTNFLVRRAAVGNRISSLKLHCYPRTGESVVESIRHVVEVLEV
jgi:hypothetical protein